MSQGMRGTNVGQRAQWTGQLRKQVKVLLEEQFAEIGRQVRTWREAVRPLIGAMRAARGRRAGFVRKLKGAGPDMDGGRAAASGAKRPGAKKPRWEADGPGFVQNILGLKRPRKSA